MLYTKKDPMYYMYKVNNKVERFAVLTVAHLAIAYIFIPSLATTGFRLLAQFALYVSMNARLQAYIRIDPAF